jgi:signal transduction histidine kinase
LADYKQLILQNAEWEQVYAQEKLLVLAVRWVDTEDLIYIGAPIHSSGRTLGVLSILYDEAPLFSVEEIALIGSIADQFGRVVENATLLQLSQKSAVIEERQRLARDLHDAVSQSVYSLVLFANSGEEASQNGDANQTRFYLQRIQEVSQQALREMRLLIYELRPVILEQEGLVGALRQRLEAVEHRAGLQIELEVKLNTEIAPFIEMELFRVAQEALNNVVKHSHASQVLVRLSQDQGNTLLEVKDNGSGFNPELAASQGGYGLHNMQDRVTRLGGSLSIITDQQQGTCISANVPSDSQSK